MSCTNCGSAFHEKWACTKPPRDVRVSEAIPSRVSDRQPARRQEIAPSLAPIAEEAKGNVGASAGRLHSQKTVPTGSPANVPGLPKSDRHKPGYMKDYMKKRRAKNDQS